MAKKKLTPFAKFLMIFLVLGGLVGAYFALGGAEGFQQLANESGSSSNSGDNSSSSSSSSGGSFDNSTGKTLKIGVVTWGGYAAGQYWNQGFEPNEGSWFRRDYGFDVEFKVLDDFVQSRQAWQADEVDLIWATVDAFPTEAGSLPGNPQMVFQADWSRGGDAIVSRPGVNRVSDLKGKSVAVALMTPSHSFLINLVNASNINMSDIRIIEVASAIDAAQMFKSNQVDAAVVWSPDDLDCLEQVRGSKILASTKTATNIIADGFFAKKEFIDNNVDILSQLYEGWMKGAAILNDDPNARRDAAKILEAGLNVPYDFATQAIGNVRFTTHGDNLNFFGINRSFQGVTGQDLFSGMATQYQKLGYLDKIPNWRSHHTTKIVKAVNLAGSEHAAEASIDFAEATEEEATAEAVSTKAVTITFALNSSTLDDNAKYIIDVAFLDIARQFANQRIRVVGNSDNTGGRQVNLDISKKRAQAVVNYMVNEHGFDADRFVVIGAGPDNPVATNKTAEGRRKNRRTDFELI